jgi:hypothetical protein
MTKKIQSVPVLLWAICYTLWLLFFATGFWLIIQVRLVLMALGRLTPANHWILGAVDRYALLLLGVVWLILVFVLEAYLRGGVHKGIFWSRVGRVVVWLVGFLVLMTGLQFLLG